MAFFSLLHSGLWGKEPNTDYFPLSSQEWMQLYQISLKQTLVGIIYDGVEQLPIHLHPPRVVLLRWVAAVAHIEKANNVMDRQIEDIATLFCQHKIEAYLIKGQGIAMSYPNPRHRTCGDIDWAFPSVQHYKKANRLIQQQGVSISPMPGFSSEYTWNGVLCEHHLKVIDIYSPLGYHVVRKVVEEEQKNSRQCILPQQGVAAIPSPLLTHLIVNVHIIKHFLSYGIGMRQLCDSAIVCYAYKSEVDGEKLKEIYNKLHVLRWIHGLHQVLVDHLGLEEQYLPFPLERRENMNWMLEEVLYSGNFGYYDSRFGGVDISSGRRKKRLQHLLHRFRKNIHAAPMETIFFPIIQAYSRYFKHSYF